MGSKEFVNLYFGITLWYKEYLFLHSPKNKSKGWKEPT